MAGEGEAAAIVQGTVQGVKARWRAGASPAGPAAKTSLRPAGASDDPAPPEPAVGDAAGRPDPGGGGLGVGEAAPQRLPPMSGRERAVPPRAHRACVCVWVEATQLH